MNEVPKETPNPLKMLVISLGLLLIGGFALFFALAWQKITASPVIEACAGRSDLKGRGNLVEIKPDGKNLLITMQKSKETRELLTVDKCSGKILSALTVETDF